MLARTGADWLPVDGKANQDAGTLAGDTSQRSFEIAGLDPGRYKVKVWGEITHPNNGGTADVTSSEVTSAGDYRSFPSHMRDGVIGVGTPGEKPASSVGTRGLQAKWGACGWHHQPPGWWHFAAAALTLHVAVTARPMHCSQRPAHLCCWSYPVAPMSAGTPQVTFSASISDMTMRITGLDGPDNGKLGSSAGLQHMKEHEKQHASVLQTACSLLGLPVHLPAPDCGASLRTPALQLCSTSGRTSRMMTPSRTTKSG